MRDECCALITVSKSKVPDKQSPVDKVFYSETLKVLMLIYKHDDKLFEGVCQQHPCNNKEVIREWLI